MFDRLRDPSRKMKRFTERARQAMELAGHEARKLNHAYIGTEHILLGLTSEGSGVGANAITALGLDLPKIRREVRNLVRPGPDKDEVAPGSSGKVIDYARPAEVEPGGLPMTPRARKVIDYALEESRILNHDHVGTEHLLLALVREQDGVAAQVLMNLGVQMEDIRPTVLSLIGADVEKNG